MVYEKKELPISYQTLPDADGCITRTSFKFGKHGKIIKTVSKIKMITKRVYKSAIERQNNWVKFGLAAISNEGVTTVSDELIFMEDPLSLENNEINETNEINKKEKEIIIEKNITNNDTIKDKKTKIICNICKGDHWSRICPSKNEKNENIITTPEIEKHIVVRVLNVATDVTEPDLYELFSCIRNIQYIYILKDFETRMSRGVAYIGFKNIEDAEMCISKFNNFGYNYLLLKLELANNV